MPLTAIWASNARSKVNKPQTIAIRSQKGPAALCDDKDVREALKARKAQTA